MKRKRLPAWQQVLLVVLGNVPGAKGGHDAWEQLNGEEKAAVMEFSGAPLPKVKRSAPRWRQISRIPLCTMRLLVSRRRLGQCSRMGTQRRNSP